MIRVKVLVYLMLTPIATALVCWAIYSLIVQWL